MAEREENREKLAALCRRFGFPGELTEVRPLSGGHINTTCAVTLAQGGAVRRLVLQRINGAVFRDPAGLMANVGLVTGHIRERGGTFVLPWYPGPAGAPCVRLDREVWRACDYVENARTFGAEEADEELLERAGAAYGRFLRALKDLDPARLTETVPRFHDTACRLEECLAAAAADPLGRGAGAAAELALLRAARPFAADFSRRRDHLPLRVTHNDAKLENLLFHRDARQVLAVIDLDTCMPGRVCYDFGDLVRSGAWRSGGAGRRLDPARFRACARGFLGETADLLTGAEARSLAPGAAAVTLELAARFLGDYLTGDRYFPPEYPGHNLDRARRQLALYRDMRSRLAEMEGMVRACLAEFSSAPPSPPDRPR